MMNFNFIASDKFNVNDFNSFEKFVDAYPDFQTLTLNSEDELELLTKLMGISELIGTELTQSEFSKYWDLSVFQLPELNEMQIEQFYKNWIEKSCRGNNMDEFGSLIFLHGMSPKWNRMKFRLIVKEK